jgi:hypothetical protein
MAYRADSVVAALGATWPECWPAVFIAGGRRQACVGLNRKHRRCTITPYYCCTAHAWHVSLIPASLHSHTLLQLLDPIKTTTTAMLECQQDRARSTRCLKTLKDCHSARCNAAPCLRPPPPFCPSRMLGPLGRPVAGPGHVGVPDQGGHVGGKHLRGGRVAADASSSPGNGSAVLEACIPLLIEVHGCRAGPQGGRGEAQQCGRARQHLGCG